MFRTNYTAIQELTHASHPSVPFFVATLLGLAFIFLPAMFRRTNKFPVKGRLVLVTGGSQGLGEAIAIEFAKRGADVVLVSRSEEKLKLASKNVEAARVSPEQKFSYFSADLSKAEEAQKAITSCKKVPDIVFCCAGAAIPGFFADQSVETLDFMIKTVYYTALWTAHAAINAMIRSPQPPGSPRRKLVFTSSLVAFSVIPGYASYAPAKAAMRMLADTLREECLLYDIDVHCSFPANILSPGFEVEEQTKPAITKKIEGTASSDKPDVVAKHLMNHLERGHKHITYEFEGTLVKNMMCGMTERDTLFYDFFAGLCGSIAFPFVRSSWRKMILNYKDEHAKRELPPWPQ